MTDFQNDELLQWIDVYMIYVNHIYPSIVRCMKIAKWRKVLWLGPLICATKNYSKRYHTNTHILYFVSNYVSLLWFYENLRPAL